MERLDADALANIGIDLQRVRRKVEVALEACGGGRGDGAAQVMRPGGEQTSRPRQLALLRRRKQAHARRPRANPLRNRELRMGSHDVG